MSSQNSTLNGKIISGLVVTFPYSRSTTRYQIRYEYHGSLNSHHSVVFEIDGTRFLFHAIQQKESGDFISTIEECKDTRPEFSLPLTKSITCSGKSITEDLQNCTTQFNYYGPYKAVGHNCQDFLGYSKIFVEGHLFTTTQALVISFFGGLCYLLRNIYA